MKDVEIWLDMDGVLADFDKGAQRVLGTDNTYKFEFIHGTAAFWEALNAAHRFFLNLMPMPDMHILMGALHGKKLGVLTALPHTGADKVAKEKQDWVDMHLGSWRMPVVTCLTKDKPNYCTPGSVLIDDRAVNRDMWITNGGRFIVHENARSTIYQLKSMGVI